jgi:hypothetical protein
MEHRRSQAGKEPQSLVEGSESEDGFIGDAAKSGFLQRAAYHLALPIFIFILKCPEFRTGSSLPI